MVVLEVDGKRDWCEVGLSASREVAAENLPNGFDDQRPGPAAKSTRSRALIEPRQVLADQGFAQRDPVQVRKQGADRKLCLGLRPVVADAV